jgi:hypothetical protein
VTWRSQAQPLLCDQILHQNTNQWAASELWSTLSMEGPVPKEAAETNSSVISLGHWQGRGLGTWEPYGAIWLRIMVPALSTYSGREPWVSSQEGAGFRGHRRAWGLVCLPSPTQVHLRGPEGPC